MNDLTTLRGEALSGTPYDIYPRPQMRRESYVNLNGTWEFAIAKGCEPFPAQYPRRIQVPFCPESQLSGLKMAIAPGSWLFYRRRFPRPAGARVRLHVGAADQLTDIYVNQMLVGGHSGGYNAFSCDITDALQEDNELIIRCYDDLRDTSLPYGKQSLQRGGMWYTPVSGIWQSVWLEVVPEAEIRKLHIRNEGYGVTISIEPPMAGSVTVPGLGEYPLTDGSLTLIPEAPHLWSPEDPYLYEFTVKTAEDTVHSYFALRTIEVKLLHGIPRLCLNGKPYFFHGLLDQGYWPDGIYTPADPRCYADDILAMKNLGFNMLRKHIKVEPEEFYYQCDKLGMVVFQDMVNNSDYSFLRDTALPTAGIQKLPDRRLHRDALTRERFYEAMDETVAQLQNHPCILYWTIFNEGWGQFDADRAYTHLKALDSSRIIDATSGWFRQKYADVDSRHIYFTPWSTLQSSGKPLVLSEFGGYAYPVEGHLFNPGNAYGYKSCKSLQDFQDALDTLYRSRVLPAVRRGVCAAVYTQVSDVEDEINGLLTYDRKVCKADRARMLALAEALQKAVQ